MTSNPTIFEKAIAGSRLYDDRDPRARPTRAGPPARSSRTSPWPTCSAACDVFAAGVRGHRTARTAWCPSRCRPTLAQRHRGHDPRGRAALALGRPAERDDQDSRARAEGLPAITQLHRGRDQRQRHAAVLGRALRRGDRGVPGGLERGLAAGQPVRTDRVGRELLREPGRRQGRPAARPARRSRAACAGRSPSPTPAWRTGCSRRRSHRRAGSGSPGGGAAAAAALGLDQHQGPALSRRALRRGADRPAHGQHAAARDLRGVPRPRPAGGADRGGHDRARRHSSARWPSSGSISPASPTSSRPMASPSSPRRTPRCSRASRPRPARWSAADAARASASSRSPGGSSSGWARGILLGWLAPDFGGGAQAAVDDLPPDDQVGRRADHLRHPGGRHRRPRRRPEADRPPGGQVDHLFLG